MAREGSDLAGPDVAYPPAVDGAPSRALAPVNLYESAPPAFGMAPPRGPEILHGGFNQTWLSNCLRRRWLMALLMGMLIAAGVSVLLLYLFPITHQTTAYLKVRAKNENQVFPSDNNLMPQDIERQAMNHLAMLKSQLVLEAALAKREINTLDAVQAHKGEEVLWLASDLRVSYPGDGEILAVSYEGRENFEEMKKVVDAVVAAYQEKVLWNDRLTLAATRADLETVLDSAKQRLQDLREKLRQTMEAKNSLDPEVEVPRLRAVVSRLEQLISGEQQNLVNIEIFMQLAWETSRSPLQVEQAIAAAMEKDPIYVNYQTQLFSLQQAVAAREQRTRNPNDAQLRQLKAQLEQTEAMMRQHRASLEKSAREQIARLPNDALRAARLEYQIRKQAAEGNLERYNKELEDANDSLKVFAVRDPELEMMESDIASEEEIVTSLSKKVLEWQFEKQARDQDDRDGVQSDFDKVVVMQRASALPATNRMERYSIAGIGGFAALALTCYGVALLEFRHRRLNGPTDIDEGLGIRVLGVLPTTSLKQLGGNSLVATQVAEAIDNVRATLMHDAAAAARQVILVTSSSTQEGNTVVAASLALSLSRAGRRTLLIDGDLRSPSLHKLFGMALDDGFSEVLRAELDLADAVRPTNNEGLYLLTAGVCSADAIHALATDQPHAIFEKLRDQFDFIVIDAPPVLGISDSLSLGQYVDGAILTVLRDHSQIRKVHKSVELLRGMGIKVLGSVVNGVPVKADRRVVRLHQATMQQPPRLTKAEG